MDDIDDIDDIGEIFGLSSPSTRPEPPDDFIDREQKLIKHVDGLERRVGKSFAADGDEEDNLPATIDAMSDWRRAKDVQVGNALGDIVAVAELDKAEGNRLFQEGQYQASYAAYKKSLDAFEDFSEAMLTTEAKKLVVALYCNAAQALLRCTDVSGASSDGARVMAEKALELEPTNVKALFRRGCAHGNAEDWNLAKDDLRKVLRIEPNNEAARRELQRIRELAENELAGRAERAAAKHESSTKTTERPSAGEGPDAEQSSAATAPKRSGRGGAFSASIKGGEVTKRDPRDAEKIDAMREEGEQQDPAKAVKTAQAEARKLRQALLKRAEREKKVMGWTARMDAADANASEWAKHQLSDPESVRDLVLFRGAGFGAMTLRQKKDFLTASGFVGDVRRQYATEVSELFGSDRL